MGTSGLYHCTHHRLYFYYLQTEHRNPEGRTYWFNTGTKQSVWEKPDGAFTLLRPRCHNPNRSPRTDLKTPFEVRRSIILLTESRILKSTFL
jgi:hypothetical protein